MSPLRLRQLRLRSLAPVAALVAAIAAALALIPFGAAAFGAAAPDEPSGATVAVERRAPADASPPLAELYQSVLSFGPGTWTAPHTHAGGSYNTVIRGQVTLRVGDAERTFGPGEGWADQPGVLHVAGNAGPDEAQLIAVMVVTPGVPPAAIVDTGIAEDELPPPPDVLALTKGLAALPPGPLDVVEQTIDLAAGAPVTLPPSPGPRLIGVVDGTVAVEIAGARHTFEAGRGWSETAGAAHTYTAGEGGARIAVTTLLPREAPVAGQ